MEFKFPEVVNYYGELKVKEEEGKYYWGIEDQANMEWSEIPKYLYDTLFRYYKNK